MSAIDTLRLIGIPETNKVMAAELSRLSARAFDRRRLAQPRKAGTGTLIYPFDRELAHLAAHYHRTSSRVLWDLYQSSAEQLEPLYDDVLAAASADDRAFCWDGATLSIRARNLAAFAAGERQIVGAVKNALVDGCAARGMSLRVDPDRPDLVFALRMHDQTVTVSLDLVGRSMHQRGYRAASGEAPLRENLAAVLVMLTRWDARREVLFDAMTGSGTIAIEAALQGRAVPLWTDRPAPVLHRLPGFESARLALEPLFADTAPRVAAVDRDAPLLATARNNAELAGVSRIGFDVRDCLTLEPADVIDLAGGGEPGVILANPPYGERLAAERALYRDLGRWARKFSGWRAGFIIANRDFEDDFGGRARIRKPLRNGPQKAMFLLYDL